MNTNFVFVRHGHGCHNAIGNLVNNETITIDQGKKFLGKGFSLFNNIKALHDPELTPIGVDVSINNGCIINKIIKYLWIFEENDKLKMNEINVVGCSPLIRCMETAYFMTRKWKNPPKKIYVFPLLREIDESSVDKYSKKSLKTMETTPSYSMKTINEQKKYLKSIELLDFFDFSFVESNLDLRKEPGDIVKFINWFNNFYVSNIQPRDNLNVFIVTHAGVLKDYSNEGFYNNSGFVLNGELKNTPERTFKFSKYTSLNSFLPKHFFKDYNRSKWNEKSYYCPSNRCGEGSLCTIAKGNADKLDKINLEECKLDEDE